MDQYLEKISKAEDFIKTDIWRIRLHNLPFARSFLIKQLRILILAVRGFDEDKCSLRASALTFNTLLAIVPVAAMAFGIAKGFGFEKVLEQQLIETFAGQQEVVTRVIDFARSLLENTRGGVIAGIGLILLFWSVVNVLGHIESSFNEIWEIQESRSFGRKFSDYLAIMLISTILLIMSSSVMVFITTQVKLITEKVALLGYFSPLISFVLKFLPYGLIWILFTIIYIIMPNTRVSFKSGLIAGIIAGTIYQLLQWAYIALQIGVARYNAIYGSFAALPLFLIWLHWSWLIVLFGAEISFANQNVSTYEFEPDSKKASPAFRKLLALQITHFLVKNFIKGDKPQTDEQISQKLEIPIRLVHQILYDLVESRVLVNTASDAFVESAYQPGIDPSRLTVKFVLDAMDEKGIDDIPVARNKELNSLTEALKAFSDAIESSPANKLLRDI
jgi:membrane protein